VTNNGNITRYVRFTPRSGGEPRYGILDGDTIHELRGDLFENPQRTGQSYNRLDVTLGLPLDPRRVQKVLGIAGNTVPPGVTREVPHGRWFCKYPTSLNAHGGEVEVPPDAVNFNEEGELVLVIGKKGRHISLEDAPSHIFGVTVGNDYSENTWIGHRLGRGGQSPLLSKATDSWAGLYHTIVTGLDTSDLRIQVRLNGEINAQGSTAQLIHKPAQLVNYISAYMTLMPGDIIYTGTVAPQTLPGRRKEFVPGDVVEIELEGVGTLMNRLVPMKGHNTYLATR
jgi:2-keto-4-pentenoate hydratase/2-oxohepta-3-ene-1,7-dioic acid hydratase in catechol pathway